MATAQEFSSSVTAVSAMSASIRRRSAALTCATCGRLYTSQELVERRVRRAHTKDGRDFLSFDCRCGDGTSVAGAVAYDPADEMARVATSEDGAGDVSHYVRARQLLTSAALAEAREGFTYRDENRAKVDSQMRAVEARLAAFVSRFGGNGSSASTAKSFVRKLTNTCKSLVKALDDAQANVSELDAVCAVLSSGEVPDALLQDKSVTSDALIGTLQSLYTSIDAASMELFSRHIEVTK